MNWYNELCGSGCKETKLPDEVKPSWATHSFRRMGRTLYGQLFTDNWFWMNEEHSLYYMSEDIDTGSVVRL